MVALIYNNQYLKIWPLKSRYIICQLYLNKTGGKAIMKHLEVQKSTREKKIFNHTHTATVSY